MDMQMQFQMGQSLAKAPTAVPVPAANPPAWNVIGSAGFSGSAGNVFTNAFDDEFGGDGVWNQAYGGDELTKDGSGIASLIDAAALGLMFATSASSDYTATADDGVLLQGWLPEDSLGDFTVARRTSDGHAVLLRLVAGAAPACVIATRTTTAGTYTIASTTNFDTDVVAAERKNYYMRVVEVADVEPGDGGLDVELYVGDWEAEQTSEEIRESLVLVDTLELRTAAARTYRDTTKDNVGRGVMRRATAGGGNPSTFDGIHWMTH